MNDRKDEDLVLTCRQGDTSAYAALVQRHYRHVFALCLGTLANVHDAEDTAQETMLKGFLSLRKLCRPEQFEPWILRIAGQLFGRVELLTNSVVVGREFINGAPCDIWEVDIAGPLAGHTSRMRHWLSAADGRLVRAQVLSRRGDGEWELDQDYQTIEYDLDIPENTFAMEPPDGYTIQNTKETAPILDIGSGGCGYNSFWCSILISFTLSDGAVVMGWRSYDNESQQPQDLLYKDLTLGGPLPKLPVEIYGIKPAGIASDVTYTGYHLASTHKGDKFSEWSLYVPSGTPPASIKELGYAAIYKFNLDEQPKWIIGLNTDYGVPIETAEDFDTWVLGAMAELSDSGIAPAQVTYPAVQELIRQIHAGAK